MPHIMGNNRVHPSSYRQFKNEFVAGVRQDRPYLEMDVGLPAYEAEGANDRVNSAFRDL